jgi:hypothetical protein
MWPAIRVTREILRSPFLETLREFADLPAILGIHPVLILGNFCIGAQCVRRRGI